MRLLLFLVLLFVGPSARPSAGEMLGVLFVGQSNMVGGNQGPREALAGGLDDLGERVYCLDRSDRVVPWHLPYPFALSGQESGSSLNVSPATAFVRRLAAAYPQHDICIVFCARGASGYNKLIPDPERNWAAPGSPNKLPNNLFDDSMRRVLLARAQGVEFVAGVHYMGESDAAVMSPAELAFEVGNLISEMRRGTGSIPWVMGSMPPWPGSPFINLQDVDAGLALVTQTVPETVLAWSNGLTPNHDLAHFDTASARILGERMYDALDAACLLPKPGGLGTPPAWAQPDSSTYLPLPALVLHQDFTNDVWFESYSDALGGGRPSGDQFSNLERFESFRRGSGEFLLAVEWGSAEQIVWRQTSNPFEVPRDVVEGFEVIADPYELVSAGLFDGLCRTTVSGAVLAFQRHGTTLLTPSCGLFLYNDYKLAQQAGFEQVLVTPLGLRTHRVTLRAL